MVKKNIYEFRIQAELFIHIFYLSFLNLHNQFDYDKYRVLLMVYGVVSCLEMCHDMIILKTFSDYFFCSYFLFQLFIWPATNCGLPCGVFFICYLCLIILIGSINMYNDIPWQKWLCKWLRTAMIHRMIILYLLERRIVYKSSYLYQFCHFV